MKQIFSIIGISDSRKQEFSSNVEKIISEGRVFSGGRRHFEIVEEFLPKEYEWINITVPLDKVFEQYEKCEELVVFASGDPLFFGFANTVRNRMPDAEIKVFPYFNSVQMLAHKFLLPYSSARIVSLTGREWKMFDAALIHGEKMLGVLTDRHKTPVTIAQRMMKYGYTNYKMFVGEMMGNEQEERYRMLSIEEAVNIKELKHPNAIILEQKEEKNHRLGIPENEFALLDGRKAMITKMPIRLLTLSLLELENKSSLWDIGFCTGSVSIEAKLQFPELDITSFEVRKEGRELMEENSRRFGTPGINTYIGDFMEAPLEDFPQPDAVFIGGHNGMLVEMMQRISEVIKPGGIIVLNSVTDDSHKKFIQGVLNANLKMVGETRIAIDNHNPIKILKAQK